MPFKKTTALRLDFYNPDGSLSVQLSNDIEKCQVIEQSDKSADMLSASILNYLAAHTGAIDLDQEVRVFAQKTGEGALSQIWTGIVTNFEPDRSAKTMGRMKLSAQDYVFRVLMDRDATFSYNGSDCGAAIIELCATYAPEVDTSQISSSLGVALVMQGTGQKLFDVIVEIARRADCTVTSDYRKRLYVLPRASVSSGLTVDYTKVADGSLKVSKNRPEANVVRVWGGSTIIAGDLNNPATKTMTTVSQSSRALVKFYAAKHKVTSVELWTDPTLTASGEDIVVRIQADQAGAPVNPANYQLDLAIKTLSSNFLAVGGWTTFGIPDHTLGAGQNYWLIIETSSTVGQKIGYDQGTPAKPAYKVWHPSPIIVERSDQASINAHRRIVKTIRRRTIVSVTDATQLADSELARLKDARWDASYEVVDQTAEPNNLDAVLLGQTMTVNFPSEGIAGAFQLTKRTHVFDGEGSTYSLLHTATQKELTMTLPGALAGVTQRLAKVEDAVIGTNNSFLTDLFRAFADSFKLNDSIVRTVGSPGFVVDTSQIGFFSLT